MSEHSDNKQSAVGALIMLLILGVLVALGIGTMNGGNIAGAAIPAGLLFLFGLYPVFVLGKD